MSGWSKPTSDTATAIGERAAARLIDHGVVLNTHERALIARACALAADEVLDDERDVSTPRPGPVSEMRRHD